MYSILVYMYCTVFLDHTVTLVQIGGPVAARPIYTSLTVLLKILYCTCTLLAALTLTSHTGRIVYKPP